MDEWIIVRNWDTFQHYKDRTPVWVKVYLELADNEDWVRLTFAQRGLLVSLWLEYGSARGQLPLSAVPARLRQKVLKRTIESLVDTGFLDIVASKPLALARARERAGEVEVEVEDKKPRARTRKKPKTTEPVARENVIAADPYQAIAAMIRNGVITDDIDLDAEIAGYNLDQQLAQELHRMLAAP